MAEPLLSTLCQICHISSPIYTCPRCHQRTCSLPCAQRHKVWSSCNGIRDPTVFKPMAQLATPSGIDHDYNFLHGMELCIEKSEKEIVVERRLLDARDLNYNTKGRQMRAMRENQVGDTRIAQRANEMRLEVIRAPKGLKRRTENTTNWAKKKGLVHWQIEWLRIGEGQGRERRALGKVMDNLPIGQAYRELCETEARVQLLQEGGRSARKRGPNQSEAPAWKGSSEEQKSSGRTDLHESNIPMVAPGSNAKKRRSGKKRRRAEVTDDSEAKRSKIQEAPLELEYITSPILQDASSGAWSLTSTKASTSTPAFPTIPSTNPSPPSYRLFLHRPLTPSSFPKVIVPLDPTRSLSQILRFRAILEFPTIYVMDPTCESLPDGFMLERDYAARTGQAVPRDVDIDADMLDGDLGTAHGDEHEDETSSSAISSSSDNGGGGSSSSSSSSSSDEGSGDDDTAMEDGETKVA